jgi:hypothetical protein
VSAWLQGGLRTGGIQSGTSQLGACASRTATASTLAHQVACKLRAAIAAAAHADATPRPVVGRFTCYLGQAVQAFWPRA